MDSRLVEWPSQRRLKGWIQASPVRVFTAVVVMLLLSVAVAIWPDAFATSTKPPGYVRAAGVFGFLCFTYTLVQLVRRRGRP